MIKQPIFAVLSLVLLLAAAGYSVERLLFLQRANHTIGSVTQVTARDARCRGRRHRYECTRFSATIAFTASNREHYQFDISAGRSRGYGQPISGAYLAAGNQVPVVYDPLNPPRAYRDDVWDVWGLPIMLFLFQFGSLVVSFQEKRSKSSRGA